eukprot:TRINITY_DN1819_c0_g1_i9.p1 TRINITY_DN1819_c0_g1~~TRINITY_DN1819_c0_g1_i9.p1  ORF type:complete len:446 (-),score=63.91 TRINITY_DN1819_c0_g1_i9:393-1730(-)
MFALLSLIYLFLFPLAFVVALFRWFWRPKKRSRNPHRRVAVVGGGIAGCGAAWALQKAGCTVVLYEAREQLGGNAKTHQWDVPGNPVTGLSVLAWPKEYFNNYEKLIRDLNVPTQTVNLGFFIDYDSGDRRECFAHGQDTPLSRELRADFEKWERLVKFVKDLNWTLTGSSCSLYDMSYLNPLNFLPLLWLTKFFGISRQFWNAIVIPIYSSTFLTVNLAYVPAVVAPTINTIIPLTKLPQLQTWTNSSAEVFNKMVKNIEVRTNTPVQRVVRKGEEIHVIDKGGNCEKFSEIIFACPSTVVYQVLYSASLLEQILLWFISYTDSTDDSFLEGQIHSDQTVLPAEHRDVLLHRGYFANYILVYPQDRGFRVENTFLLSSWIPAVRERKKTEDLQDEAPMLITYNSKKKLENVVGKVSNAQAHPDLSFRNLMISFFLRYVQVCRRG